MAHPGWLYPGYPYAQQEQQPQQPQWLEQQPPAEAVPPAWLYEAAPPLPVDDAPPLPSEMPPPLPEYQYPEPQPPLPYTQPQHEQPPTSAYPAYPPPSAYPAYPPPMVQEPSPAVYPVQQPDQPSHMPPQSHLMQQPMVAQTPQYMAQGMPTQMHPMLAQQHYLQQQQMLQQQHHQHHMHQQHMAMQSNQMGLAPNQMAQQQQQQMAMHQMWTAQQQQQQQQPQPQPAQMVQRPMQPDAGANGHRDRGRSGSAGPAAVRKDRMRQSKPLIDTCATVKDARDIFRAPGRSRRPAKIAVLLRGLPGSGKTRVARALRDAEVDAGAEPPKVHCLDDYFMTEVEKEVVEEELGVSGKTVKRRRKLLTTEYEFEAELEPAYKASLLKGLARTAQEGRFSVVIVDCCNVKAKELTEQHSILKAEGYEVYVLQPAAKDHDPQLCAGRNVHGRTLEEVRLLAAEWQPSPLAFTRLNAGPLCDGDASDAAITEVDMDAEGEGDDDHAAGRGGGDRDGAADTSVAAAVPHGLGGSRWAAAGDDDDDATAAAARDRKRQRRDREVGAAGASGVEEGDIHVAIKNLASAMGGKKGRRVRWVDEEAEKEAAKGFTIGGGGGQQLRPFEEVFVVAGMGPANDEGEMARAVLMRAQGRFGVVKEAQQ